MTEEPLKYYRGWIEIAKHEPVGFGKKVRIKRTNGTRGYSTPILDLEHRPQLYWKDPNGDEHPLPFYTHYAFFRSEGGLV